MAERRASAPARTGQGPPRPRRFGGWGRRRLPAALTPLLFSLLLAPAQTPSPSGPSEGAAAKASSESSESPQPSPREQALAGIRAEIDDLEGRLDELKLTARGLAGELESTELELTLQQKRLVEAEAAQQLAAEKVEASAAAVSRLKGELERAREGLRARLQGLYRLGGYGYLRLVLSIDPGTDPLEAVRVLRYLARRDARAIERYVDTSDRLVAEQEVLEAERQEVATWAAEEKQRRDRLAQIRRRQQRLLAEVEAERAEVAARAEALEEKERKLSHLLAVLAESGEEPLEGQPMQVFRGVLDWPAEGEVTRGFGPRRDPRYRTQLPHNGIEIAVAAGAEVRVVYPGTVLFAAPFEGYGTMVVVHHPGRVFSLYAGLSSLRAEKGDVLSLEDAVGLAAETLYFEIRVEQRPENPLEWLR